MARSAADASVSAVRISASTCARGILCCFHASFTTSSCSSWFPIWVTVVDQNPRSAASCARATHVLRWVTLFDVPNCSLRSRIISRAAATPPAFKNPCHWETQAGLMLGRLRADCRFPIVGSLGGSWVGGLLPSGCACAAPASPPAFPPVPACLAPSRTALARSSTDSLMRSSCALVCFLAYSCTDLRLA